MIGALDEGQPRDDFRRRSEFKRRPPGSGARDRESRNEAEIALGFGDRFDHARGADMRHKRHREAEMEARGIAHQRVARRQVGMHRKRRLHVSEGRNNDAPDGLGGFQRQGAAMPLDQPPHHVGLARRAEGRAGLLGLLDRDQGVDDLAALEQKRMHGLIDAVDLAPQIGKRDILGVGQFRHGLRSGGAGD